MGERVCVCVCAGGGKAHSRGQFGGNVRLVGFTSVQQCARPHYRKHTRSHTLVQPFVKNRKASCWHVPD